MQIALNSDIIEILPLFLASAFVLLYDWIWKSIYWNSLAFIRTLCYIGLGNIRWVLGGEIEGLLLV